MLTFTTIVHVFVSILLICAILLQSGRGGGLAGLGGAAAGQVFGGRGAGNFLTKLTSTAAIVFFLTSMVLSFGTSSKTSVITQVKGTGTCGGRRGTGSGRRGTGSSGRSISSGRSSGRSTGRSTGSSRGTGSSRHRQRQKHQQQKKLQPTLSNSDAIRSIKKAPLNAGFLVFTKTIVLEKTGRVGPDQTRPTQPFNYSLLLQFHRKTVVQGSRHLPMHHRYPLARGAQRHWPASRYHRREYALTRPTPDHGI